MVPLTVRTFLRELTVSAVMTVLATPDTTLTASAVVLAMTKLILLTGIQPPASPAEWACQT